MGYRGTARGDPKWLGVFIWVELGEKHFWHDWECKSMVMCESSWLLKGRLSRVWTVTGLTMGQMGKWREDTKDWEKWLADSESTRADTQTLLLVLYSATGIRVVSRMTWFNNLLWVYPEGLIASGVSLHSKCKVQSRQLYTNFQTQDSVVWICVLVTGGLNLIISWHHCVHI